MNRQDFRRQLCEGIYFAFWRSRQFLLTPVHLLGCNFLVSSGSYPSGPRVKPNGRSVDFGPQRLILTCWPTFPTNFEQGGSNGSRQS
ncbi:hypothetical protein BQ8482_380314 [Mesorhizobium delmotii]|uniref:Uncharacterized protein n=1 Tax=Mesorhizobium delmotii TaxID=1631247 RepID=A0A2P9ASI9_9HYPH|nr:hypothetical protein BQ8482_380314 [Mesorhizobium delmotii]